ncbi:MAG: hypothetical protein Q9214_005781 [Letrouitia sp. 1 TL-2023]
MLNQKHAMNTNTRTKWNYTFQWTDRHLSRQETDPLRYKFDELGAAALEKLQEISAQNSLAKDAQGARPRLDLYAVLRDNHEKDQVLCKFWDELHTVPDWVDWEQIARGQKFLYRYAAANFTGFALQGFVGENSVCFAFPRVSQFYNRPLLTFETQAATGVVEVLVRTGGFSTRVLLHRLMETFQWLLQVTHGLSCIQPHGEGHASTVRIRLLHASVRQRIMKLVQSRPEYFNVEKYGVPVNTLDSIHSITTFCCNPMWFQLPKMGIVPKQQEVDDYIALFRYIAYLLATPTEYFETSEKAKAVMESMYLHELEPTPTSKIVGYNFVKCLEDLPPMNISKEFIEAGSRWFNGNELCDALDLGRPGWSAFITASKSWNTDSATAYAQYFRDSLYHAIILSKSGLGKPTVFDFKYVPQLGKSTGKEEIPSEQRHKDSKRLSRPAERFLFVAFLMGCGILAAIGVLCVKIVVLMLGSMKRPEL